MPNDNSEAIEARASKTVFGEQNRRKLIEEYFAQYGVPTVDTAWLIVYRLLLWADSTTGLAHCYESDKSQPGKTWYRRSLAFHGWVASKFETSPSQLASELDWLFRKALEGYLLFVANQAERVSAKAQQQRSLYEGQGFPLPGTDAKIKEIVAEVLGRYLAEEPSPATYEILSEKLHAYWKQENKRKNLLGEGFEDVLAAVVKSVVGRNLRARPRIGIAQVAGFSAPGAKDKETKVDLVLEHSSWQKPTLVNVKWSFRSDREDQLWDDFNEYVRLDRDRRGFDHILITNEFDPARLNSVCDRTEANNSVFKYVVHINTDGLLAAYEMLPASSEENTNRMTTDSSWERVLGQTKSNRLISLSTWLLDLTSRLPNLNIQGR